MSKAARPWMKWYPADWRSDPGLRMCSFAARGLWADLLALMHEQGAWHCEAGPSSFYRWWNRRPNVRAEPPP